MRLGDPQVFKRQCFKNLLYLAAHLPHYSPGWGPGGHHNVVEKAGMGSGKRSFQKLSGGGHMTYCPGRCRQDKGKRPDA